MFRIVDGIEPSAIDLFMSTVRGLEIASEPSFRRRAGVSASPVDLERLIFFNSVLTNSSLIVDNLNVWRVLGESVVLRVLRLKWCSSSNKEQHMMTLNNTISTVEKLAQQFNSRSTGIVVVESLFILLIDLTAFLGNLMVLIAVSRKSIPNMYIITLALSDFLISITSISFTAAS